MSGAVLRPLVASDLPLVAQLEQRVHAYPWSLAQFHSSFDAGHVLYGFFQDEQLIAYAVLLPALDELELLTIGVAPEKQGQGVAVAFMVQLIALMQQRGVQAWLLEVRPSNEAARALYARLGFREIARRRNYYPSAQGREDALLLRKDCS